MRELSSFCALLVWLVQVPVAQFNSEQYKTELNLTQKFLQDIRVQITLEQSRIEELKREIVVVGEKNARLFSESGFSGDHVEATPHEARDLSLKQKKVIKTHCGSEKIDLFLNFHIQSADDLRVSNTVWSSSTTGSETLLNAVRSVCEDPTHWPDIYIVNKKLIFSSYYRNQKGIKSTIQPSSFSSSRLSADFYNNKADK